MSKQPYRHHTQLLQQQRGRCTCVHQQAWTSWAACIQGRQHPPGECAASRRARYLASARVSCARSLSISASFFRTCPCKDSWVGGMQGEASGGALQKHPHEGKREQETGRLEASLEEVGRHRLGSRLKTHAAFTCSSMISKSRCAASTRASASACMAAAADRGASARLARGRLSHDSRAIQTGKWCRQRHFIQPKAAAGHAV